MKRCLELFFVNHSKDIQILDVSNCSDEIPDDVWLKCVIRFKYVQSLRIVNTELEYDLVIDILIRLPHLQELILTTHQTLLLKTEERYDYTLNKDLINSKLLLMAEKLDRNPLKKLSKMQISIDNSYCSYCFLHLLLLYLPNIEYIHIHLVNYLLENKDDSRFYLPVLSNATFYWKLNLNKLVSIILTEDNYTDDDYTNKMKMENDYTLLKWILEGRMQDVPLNDYWMAPEIADRFAVQKKKEENILRSSFLNNLCSADSNYFIDEGMKYGIVEEHSEAKYVSYRDSKFENEDLENFLKFATKSLQYLCFNKVNFTRDKLIVNRFNKLLASCFLIKELNLISCHIGLCRHLFNGISKLRGLQRLALPACSEVSKCCISKTRNNITVKSSSSDSLLVSIAKKCHQLSELEIYGCGVCKSHENSELCWDTHLSALSKMGRLTSLTLVNIPQIRAARFLKDIAVNCLNIKSLRIHNLGKCNYLESLFCFLMTAPNLVHFRLGQSDIDLSDSRLWQALSKAKRLQELRVLSNRKTTVQGGEIVEALTELSSFYVFHIHAPVKIQKYRRILSWAVKRKEKSGIDVDINRSGYKWVDDDINLLLKLQNECRKCFTFTNNSYPKHKLMSSC
ncbi:uncharacterized protein LOC111638515 [Centruroides sculpturatus]|uniref:uncharacterized protein LOC111638515 n=1 Tax=Centruroides sculpturatus TaxID=218467 RepID=UPI000C6D5CA0|nr:uncharacterized protein LOC111638515 [Centruroides sculpturatus]